MWQPEQPSSHTVANFSLLIALPSYVQVGQKIGVLGVVGADLALVEQRAGRADLDAFAAARAGGLAPVARAGP